MKNLLTLVFSFTAFVFVAFHANGQDSLRCEDLKSVAYSFTIQNGAMEGDGAEFLIKKMEASQYTLLGEYHGSKNISELTKVLLPQLNAIGYKHLVVEVGLHSGDFLDKSGHSIQDVQKQLYTLNQQYLRSVEGEVSYPVPFFDKIEDAAFLGVAKAHGWKVLGIDQEFLDGYIMLVDWMFENLGEDEQLLYSDLYGRVKAMLTKLYLENDKGGTAIYTAITHSDLIQDFLNKMAPIAANKKLVSDFKTSVAIYQMNAERQWYENNGTRVKHMKKNLREGIRSSCFDLANDKMLIKMGGYHVSQGFSPMGFYDVGNMVNELAEYHGNAAVNIGFINRYWKEGEVIEDAIENGNSYIKGKQNFYRMGKEKEWVVIDLEPLRKGFYYHPQQYKLNTYEEEMIQRFDVLVIVPVDEEGTNNF